MKSPRICPKQAPKVARTLRAAPRRVRTAGGLPRNQFHQNDLWDWSSPNSVRSTRGSPNQVRCVYGQPEISSTARMHSGAARNLSGGLDQRGVLLRAVLSRAVCGTGPSEQDLENFLHALRTCPDREPGISTKSERGHHT